MWWNMICRSFCVWCCVWWNIFKCLPLLMYNNNVTTTRRHPILCQGVIFLNKHDRYTITSNAMCIILFYDRVSKRSNVINVSLYLFHDLPTNITRSLQCEDSDNKCIPRSHSCRSEENSKATERSNAYHNEYFYSLSSLTRSNYRPCRRRTSIVYLFSTSHSRVTSKNKNCQPLLSTNVLYNNK